VWERKSDVVETPNVNRELFFASSTRRGVNPKQKTENRMPIPSSFADRDLAFTQHGIVIYVLK
jgi:predicted secreted protein